MLYDFRSVPTIKQFFKSRKRIKCIMGPVGCVDEDTEYLTPSGWKKIKNYYKGQEIAVWDINSKKFYFDKPIEYIKKPADIFYTFYKQNRGFYMTVSPEHRVVYIENGKYKETLAENLMRNNYGKKSIPYILNAKKETEKISEIDIRKWILKKIRGYDLTHDGFEIRTYRKELVDRAVNLFDGRIVRHNKHTNWTVILIPCEIDFVSIYDISNNFAKLCFDEICRWSFHNRDKHGSKIWVNSLKSAEYIQYLAHMSGYYAIIKHARKHYHIYIYNDTYNPTVLRSDTICKTTEVIRDNRYKYCFTTTTGYFIARKNGNIFITGNSGKSSGCVISLLHYMAEQKPDPSGIRKTRYAIIRNTVKELKDTTKNTIDDWVHPFKPTWRESENKYIFSFKLEDGTTVNSEWLLRALDRPDQIKDLLSLELSGAWLNEAREIMKDVFDMLDGRIGRFPRGCTYPFIIMDTNPPDTDSWLYKYFEEQLPNDPKLQEKAQLWKQPSGLSSEAENLDNLPPDYYENLTIGKDPDFIKVYVHGEYGTLRMGKVVFPSFNHSVHVSKNELMPVKGIQLIIGMDFGLTPAAVICQFLPNGRMYIYDELVTPEDTTTSLQEFISFQLLPLLNSKKYFGMSPIIIGDPAGRNRSQLDKTNCFMLLRQYNLQSYPAYTNSISARVEAVNFFLNRMIDGKPAFQVSPTCRVLIKGLTSRYVFRRIRTSIEKYTDIPEKNEYSHVCDALQYAALGYNPSFTTQQVVDEFTVSTGGVDTPRLNLI